MDPNGETHIDDPDWICENRCKSPGNRSSQHILAHSQCLFWECRALKNGLDKLVPVVVDGIRDGNSKESRMDASYDMIIKE
jgi:hypothetical protein